jgi:hypothetical protein
VEKISCTDLVKNEGVLQESRMKGTFYMRQEKQCTCNVILVRVCVTIFGVKKQSLLHIPSRCPLYKLSCMQSTCAILYCQLWPVWLHYIFPHYLINGTTLRKKGVKHKMRVLFYPCVFPETSSF